MASVDEARDWLIDRISKMFGLDAPRINGHTSLEEVGLDSLTRASLAADIEKWFGISIDPDDVYEFSTIETLANRIARC